MINQVSVFGTHPGTRQWTLERQGLASVRCAVQGSREVMVTDFKSIADYAAKMEWMKPADADFFEWLSEVLGSIVEKDQLDVFLGQGGEMRSAIVDPDQALFVPLGSFVKGRILGDTVVVGVRASILDPCEANLKTFEEMRAQYVGALGETTTPSRSSGRRLPAS